MACSDLQEVQLPRGRSKFAGMRMWSECGVLGIAHGTLG